MHSKLSSTAIEALRSTLKVVEQESGVAPDDPALVELKRVLLNRIAELEAVELARAVEPGNQKATDAALELAIAPGAVPGKGDSASALAIDLAVSLLADRTTGRPFQGAKLPSPSIRTESPDQPSSLAVGKPDTAEAGYEGQPDAKPDHTR